MRMNLRYPRARRLADGLMVGGIRFDYFWSGASVYFLLPRETPKYFGLPH